MRRVLQFLGAAVVAPCVLLAAMPTAAADGVVLIGCDLFSRGGPSVEFVQSHGVSTGDESDRRLFVSGSSSGAVDFVGRRCAEVISEAIDDGLEFQAMSVSGPDGDLAIWFFQED